jgi:hypothetical protein
MKTGETIKKSKENLEVLVQPTMLNINNGKGQSQRLVLSFFSFRNELSSDLSFLLEHNKK